jgi:hypothetical protein
LVQATAVILFFISGIYLLVLNNKVYHIKESVVPANSVLCTMRCSLFTYSTVKPGAGISIPGAAQHRPFICHFTRKTPPRQPF